MVKVDAAEVKVSYDHLSERLRGLSTLLSAFHARLGRIESTVTMLASQRGESVDKMADKLIEMAMVNQGQAQPANVHRQVSRPEQTEELNDNWAEVADDWPGPNCDEMLMP